MKSPAQSRRLSGVCTFLVVAAPSVLLTGCAGFNTTATPSPVSAHVVIAGSVFGGQSPISGSHIYAFVPGTSGYASAATSVIADPPAGGNVSTDSTGNYTTTNANGQFSFTGDINCGTNPSATVYILALYGNPTGSNANGTVNNTAIALMAPAGICSNLTNAFVALNEISTVASVVTLQQFMTSATAVGTSSTNTAGLANAFALYNDLVTNGAANTTNAAGTGAIPQTKINTIADLIAQCVNTPSNTSSGCTNLFNAAPSASGVTPTDTIQTLLNLFKNPALNDAAIYSSIVAGGPFQGTVSSANDFEIAITYTNPAITAPVNVAIDGSSNVWVSNAPGVINGENGTSFGGNDALVGFTARGVSLTGTTGYTTNIAGPLGLAFDTLGNLWSVNASANGGNGAIVETTVASGASPYVSQTGLNGPVGLAIDPSNNVFVTNESQLNNSGTYASTIAEYTTASTTPLRSISGTGFSEPVGIAIDNNSNIWVSGTGSNSVLEFNDSGTLISQASGYKPAKDGLKKPLGLAIDANTNVWTVNDANSLVAVLTSSGAGASTRGANIGTNGGFAVGISNANAIAVDGFGNMWIPNCNSCSSSSATDNLLEVAAIGSTTPTQGTAANYTGNGGAPEGYQSNLLNPAGVALDSSGNVWVANSGSATVTEFIGVAGPVATPVVSTVANKTVGLRP